ncbi:MAG: acyl-CoA desaturase [Myxococcaceae bacterium]|nr:acyl-CoA desaturase [Myxococcaceae bacterium]
MTAQPSVVTFGTADEATLRAAMRDALPRDTFLPAPARFTWFLVLQAVLWSCLALIVFAGLPWWANLLLGAVMGHTLGVQGFLAHEALHGALGGPRWLWTLVGWLGFGPFLVPPAFWARWHNVAHHGQTNHGDQDPDNFGTLKRYQKNPGAAKFLRLAPGSGTVASWFFFTYSFVFHAQVVLWLQTKRRREFDGFDRRVAILQSFACAVAWVALGIASGPAFVFTVIVPLVVANTLVQSYIMTNHFLRPMAVSNNPLDNSMSVLKPRWLDPLHFRFSHHVEHHLFPTMPMHRAPRVRAWLQANVPNRFVCPPHWKAVRLLYTTPRVYADAVTLVDLERPERKIDVRTLWQPAARPPSSSSTEGAEWVS